MNTYEVPTTQHERKLARRGAGCKPHNTMPVVCVQYPDGYALTAQAPRVWGYYHGYRVLAYRKFPPKRRHVSVGRAWLDQKLREIDAWY